MLSPESPSESFHSVRRNATRRMAVLSAHLSPSVPSLLMHSTVSDSLPGVAQDASADTSSLVSLGQSILPRLTFLSDQYLNPYTHKFHLHGWMKEHVVDPMREKFGDGTAVSYRDSKYYIDKMMRKILTNLQVAPSFDDLTKNPNKVFGFFENIFVDGSLSVKISVHYCLFGMMIQLLGNEYHKQRFLQNIDDIGCFMMTELYTGTDVKSLGTTVEYNHDKKCFVVNTGDNQNQKFWIGNALVSARYGVLFGQLVLDGKNYGVHAFVVELRDENHNLKPGVIIQDCGVKGGLNALDNAAIWLDNVEIPKENLLNRIADIDQDGKYRSDLSFNKRFAHHLGALVFARIGVGSGGMSYSKVSLSIALRYSHRRKQFMNPQTGERIRIIDYELQQHRLIPLLAETFAVSFFQYYVKRVYVKYTAESDSSKASELMKQAHLMASISKAFISWLGLRSIQEARECCGGQGYLAQNRIVTLRQDSDILVTLDGINHVLLESIAQVVLSDYTKELQSKNFVSRSIYLAWEKASDALAQGLLFNQFNTSESHLCSEEFIINALDYRKERIKHTLAARLYQRIVKEKQEPFMAFNSVATHAVELGKSYSEFSIAKSFQKILARIKRENRKDPDYKKLRPLLRDMFQLYGLNCISKDTFFLENVISSRKSKAIRRQIDRLVKKITPHSLFLLEQFSLPEYIFEDTIGDLTKDLNDLHPKPQGPVEF